MNIDINWLVVLGAGLIPFLVGFLWYGNPVISKAWLAESGLTVEEAKKAGMVKTMIFTVVFGMMAALAMMPWVIHQMHYFSTLMNHQADLENKSSEIYTEATKFMKNYGSDFRTFKHGMFHGFLGALFVALPVIGMSAVYERKSWKYIGIHWIYWALSFMLMGGVICQWA